jgi:hypothetical protein
MAAGCRSRSYVPYARTASNLAYHEGARLYTPANGPTSFSGQSGPPTGVVQLVDSEAERGAYTIEMRSLWGFDAQVASGKLRECAGCAPEVDTQIDTLACPPCPPFRTPDLSIMSAGQGRKVVGLSPLPHNLAAPCGMGLHRIHPSVLPHVLPPWLDRYSWEGCHCAHSSPKYQIP